MPRVGTFPSAQDHLVTEQWLKALGTDYTILRNGWYWENNTLRFPAAVQFGSLIGCAGDAEVSWASHQELRRCRRRGHDGCGS